MAQIILDLEEYQELLDMKEEFEERLQKIEEKLFPQEQDNEYAEDSDLIS